MSGGNYNRESTDAVLASIETKLDSALQALVDQNRRIGILETAENKRTGALVAIGATCSAVGAGLAMAVEYLKGK
jgi:hypothetical protein